LAQATQILDKAGVRRVLGKDRREAIRSGQRARLTAPTRPSKDVGEQGCD
jgi:hypothetical protein